MPSAIMVASEEVEPAFGWPYKMILQNLTANPSMTPEQLATEIVNDYYSYYSDLSSADPQLALIYGKVTLSAIYVNNTVSKQLNEFVQSLMNAEDYRAIVAARHDVVEFGVELGVTDCIDLYSFAELVKLNSNDDYVKINATRLMDAINSSIIAEKHGSLYDKNVCGVSIWFPATQIEYDYYNMLYGYENLKFADNTSWDEFLRWFYNMPKPIIIIEALSKTVAKGDVAVFTGDIFGATSGNWTLRGPYDQFYSNVPLDRLHRFLILINTTDLFINHGAEVGTYLLKVYAEDSAISFDFDVVEPRVTVAVSNTTVTSGEMFEIFGTTNVADTCDLLRDDYWLTLNDSWKNRVIMKVYSSSGKLVYVGETEVKHGTFNQTIAANWVSGKYRVLVTVELNPYFNVTNETMVDVELKPLLGLTKIPKDLDDDGVLDDFNGNRKLDFDDVVNFYQHLDWIERNYPLNIVDQNKDGRLDFEDVVTLFKKI